MNPTDPRDYLKNRLAALTPRFTWPYDPAELRAALSLAFGNLSTWERPAPDVQPVSEPEACDGYTRQSITFLTRPGLRAFGYWLMPDNPTGRGVLCLPGHGIGADAVAGVVPDDYQFAFGVQCVQRGHTTFVLEQVSFGHRKDAQAKALGLNSSSCSRDAMAAIMLGENLMGWRAWDASRALDLLENHPTVDPAKLTTLGISGGGLTSLFTAALDTRVETCVVSGYFNTWADSILGVDHCIDNVAPGLTALCDMPEFAGLIAPRRLFCESGDTDPIFPLAGFEKARTRATEIYEALGCPENFATEVFEGGHKFHGVGALGFLSGSGS